MPEINLSHNFNQNPSSAFNAGNTILSYMVHPHNDKKRDEWLKLANIDIQHRLQDEPPSKILCELIPEINQNPTLAMVLRKQAIQINVTPYLILPEDAEKFLKNIDANTVKREMFELRIRRSWCTVHQILLTMMRIDRHLKTIKGGASVSRAVAFLDSLEMPYLMGNRADMMKAWREYKSIAHFLFPFFLMYSNPDKYSFCNIYTESGVSGFLVLAGNVQKWMLSQKPSFSKQEKLFGNKDLWLIPKRYKIQEMPFDVAPFTEKELLIIQSYRRA